MDKKLLLYIRDLAVAGSYWQDSEAGFDYRETRKQDLEAIKKFDKMFFGKELSEKDVEELQRELE